MPRINDYTLRDSTALQDADNFILDTPSGVFRTRLQDIKGTLGTAALLDTGTGAGELPTTSQIINLIYPVGSFYTQYPDADSNDDATAFPTSLAPATLFGGTWASQWDTESVFFRTGGNDESRTDGLQTDAFQGHYHDMVSVSAGGFDTRYSRDAIGSTAVDDLGIKDLARTPVTDDTNGTPRTSSETRPKNRKIKVWKRTA